ncbi:hypothetical protein NPIL_36171 [Nephila pilipes]|uniref:Uncharacterized protein n=1 Tax=Nephila pilipes TaxID=299642 RepID=A0A8X6MW54_NEPPI|nr:hypothetical protein NPIL_36171 [Nephila pilipes]
MAGEKKTDNKNIDEIRKQRVKNLNSFKWLYLPRSCNVNFQRIDRIILIRGLETKRVPVWKTPQHQPIALPRKNTPIYANVIKAFNLKKVIDRLTESKIPFQPLDVTKTNPGDVTGRLQAPVGDLWKSTRNLEQSHQGGTVSFACSHGSPRPLIMTQSTFFH